MDYWIIELQPPLIQHPITPLLLYNYIIFSKYSITQLPYFPTWTIQLERSGNPDLGKPKRKKILSHPPIGLIMSHIFYWTQE